MLFYALNGTWLCNGTAIDNQGLTGTNITNTTVDPLFALNVTSDFIDYGNLGIGDQSNEVPINVSNIGNQNLTITVRGYGFSEGDNFAWCAIKTISAYQMKGFPKHLLPMLQKPH